MSNSVDCSKKNKPYYRALCQHYKAIKKTYYQGVLEDFRLATWYDFYKIKLTEPMSESDRKIVKVFFDSQQQNQKKSDSFRPIFNFLSGTSNFRYPETADFLAFLLDFSPRPYALFIKSPVGDSVEKPTIANTPLKKPEVQKIKKSDVASSTAVSEEFPAQEPISTPNSSTNKLTKVLSVLGVVAVSLYIISTLVNFFKPEDRVTINNFDVQNHYYYYQDKGAIKLIKAENQGLIHKVNATPITPAIMDLYFAKNGQDTTSVDYHVVKANYFSKNKLKPIVDSKSGDVEETASFENNKNEPIQKETKLTKPVLTKKKTGKTTNNRVLYKIEDKDKIDQDLFNLIQQAYPNCFFDLEAQEATKNRIEGKANYMYRISESDPKRHICELKLSYRLVYENEIVTKEKKAIGTGFSKEAAKESAIRKIGLIIKE